MLPVQSASKVLLLLKPIFNHSREFCLSGFPFVVLVRHKSSFEWLRRQHKDEYVKKAKITSYRARSAFKLLQIDERYKILKPGQIVLDIGAAPGSWSQVAVAKVNAFIPSDAVLDTREAKLVNIVEERVNRDLDVHRQARKEITGEIVAAPSSIAKPRSTNQLHGQVIGVDLLEIASLPGATFLSRSDFTSKKTQKRIEELLNGTLVDVVLSDMAPNASGVKHLDHDGTIALVTEALHFSLPILRDNGTFLCKIWMGHGQKRFSELLRKYFTLVRDVKPDASRDDSAELYVLATGFKRISEEKVK